MQLNEKGWLFFEAMCFLIEIIPLEKLLNSQLTIVNGVSVDCFRFISIFVVGFFIKLGFS